MKTIRNLRRGHLRRRTYSPPIEFTNTPFNTGLLSRTRVEYPYPWSNSDTGEIFIHPQNPPVFDTPYAQNRTRYEYRIERKIGDHYEPYETIQSVFGTVYSTQFYPDGIYRWRYRYNHADGRASRWSPYYYFRIDPSYTELRPKRLWDTLYQELIQRYQMHGRPLLLENWNARLTQARTLIASDPQSVLRYLLYNPRTSTNGSRYSTQQNLIDLDGQPVNAEDWLFEPFWQWYSKNMLEGLAFGLDPDTNPNAPDNHRPSIQWKADAFYNFGSPPYDTWESIRDNATARNNLPNHLRPRPPSSGNPADERIPRTYFVCLAGAALWYLFGFHTGLDRLPSGVTLEQKRARLLQNIIHATRIFFQRWFDRDANNNLINDWSGRFKTYFSDDYDFRDNFAGLALLIDLLYNDFNAADPAFTAQLLQDAKRWWWGVVNGYVASPDGRAFLRGAESHYNNYAGAIFCLGCVLAPTMSAAELPVYHKVQQAILTFYYSRHPYWAGWEIGALQGQRGGYHEGDPYHLWYPSTTHNYYSPILYELAQIPPFHTRWMRSFEKLVMTQDPALPEAGFGDFAKDVLSADAMFYELIPKITLWESMHLSANTPESRKLCATGLRMIAYRNTVHISRVNLAWEHSLGARIHMFLLTFCKKPAMKRSEWKATVQPETATLKVLPQVGLCIYRSHWAVDRYTTSDGRALYRNRGVCVHYKCSPYGSNSHGNDPNHHFEVYYEGDALLTKLARSSGLYYGHGFNGSIETAPHGGNGILVGMETGSGIAWRRWTLPPFRMQPFSRLTTCEETAQYITFGGRCEKSVLAIPEYPPSHSRCGEPDYTGYSDASWDTQYLTTYYHRQITIFKTDPPIILVHDRVQPRMGPLAFAWCYTTLARPEHYNFSESVNDGEPGNFFPVAGESLTYTLYGSRRKRLSDYSLLDPINGELEAKHTKAILKFLPPPGAGVSLTPHRIWFTRPRYQVSGSTRTEIYPETSIYRLYSFLETSSNPARSATPTKRQEYDYVRQTRPESEDERRTLIPTTHLFIGMDTTISTSTLYDPITVIIPYKGTLSEKSESELDAENQWTITRTDNSGDTTITITNLATSTQYTIGINRTNPNDISIAQTTIDLKP